jgi:hypothetical protein
MSKPFSDHIKHSLQIRSLYQSLERTQHKTEWTLQEDALAFLTDAGLVGRLVMSHEKRWPIENTDPQLRHKLGECMWWLIVLSERAGFNPEKVLSEFLKNTSEKFD